MTTRSALYKSYIKHIERPAQIRKALVMTGKVLGFIALGCALLVGVWFALCIVI